MRTLFIAFAVFALIFTACGDSVMDQAKAARAQVMEVHDEMMPKMTDISKLMQKAENKAEALAADTTESGKVQYASAQSVLKQLNQAEATMNNWMADFGQIKVSEMKPEAYLKAMQAEQTKVNSMKELMLSAIEGAKKFLGDA